MRKGQVLTCNGCMAFEDSWVGGGPPGTEFTAVNNPARCGIGLEIAKIGGVNRPYRGTCPKPKNATDLVKEKTKFFDSCHTNKPITNKTMKNLIHAYLMKHIAFYPQNKWWQSRYNLLRQDQWTKFMK